MRTLDVPGVTLAVGNATWAALGTVFKTGIVYKGDQVASGYDMIPNGVYVPSTCTMTAVKITLDFPTIGGTQAWNIVLDHAGTKSTVATVTIADGARGAVTNSLSVSLVAGDLLLFQCSAANGVTFTGAGPTVQFAIGGSLSIPTAPGANGNPVATPTPTSIGLTWTAATGAFNYLIRRDGKPYAITALLAYTDLGPTGAGLSAGESHSYNVDALVPGAITVNTNSVSAAASASYSYFPAVSQNVGALTNDFVVTAGSNTTGASAAHTDATGLETLTSGATGANNVQDTVHVDWVKESATQSQSDATNRHQAIRMYTEFGFGTAAAVMNHFFNEQSYPGVSTSMTNYFQVQMTPTYYRLGIKASGINGGSFYNLSASGTSPAQCTTVGDASGHVAWPITVTVDATGATRYGLMIEMSVVKGDGSQDVKVYMGTTAQLATFIAGGATPPQVNTCTLTTAQRSALTRGHYGWEQLGNQVSTGAQTYFEKTKTILGLDLAA
jgi:hypothetical protein